MSWVYKRRKRTAKTTQLENGYRSKSEARLAHQLDELQVSYEYEKDRIPYRIERNASYLPDFRLSNGIIIEVKGWFQSKDRTKHIAIKKQYPDLDIRFLFDNSNKKLSKTSRTTYAQWCKKHGFQYADKSIPKEWTQ
jgi:hypothetical protein